MRLSQVGGGGGADEELTADRCAHNCTAAHVQKDAVAGCTLPRSYWQNYLLRLSFFL